MEQITPSSLELTVPLGTGQQVLAVVRSIPGGRYTTALLAFEDVTVSIDGQGTPGQVQLDTRAGPVIVEKLVNLVVGVTDRESVLVELNSSGWIEQESGGLVPPASFAAALNVRVSP